MPVRFDMGWYRGARDKQRCMHEATVPKAASSLADHESDRPISVHDLPVSYYVVSESLAVEGASHRPDCVALLLCPILDLPAHTAIPSEFCALARLLLAVEWPCREI